MEFYDEGRVVVVTLPLSLAERLSLTEADMDDVSALGGVVEGTDCSITMKETKDGAWKISVRTGARVNATKACAARGAEMSSLPLDELTRLWNEAKHPTE